MLAVALGARYAFGRRSAIALAGFIAVFGLALSVAVLVIVVSVVNGFERELKERIFGVLPHLSLFARVPAPADRATLAQLRADPGIVGAARFTQAAALAAAGGRVQGVLLTGIDPTEYDTVSDWRRFLRSATVADQEVLAAPFTIVLGDQIARTLGVAAGDDVTIVLPSATVTPAGLLPRQRRFKVVALLDSASDLDARAAYVSSRDAGRLLRLGEAVHGYQLRLEDAFAAGELGRRLVDQFGRDRFVGRSWMRTHGNLYQAIAMQKVTMFVLLAFLVAVAAFNLVSTLVMVVDQRAADVAILRTMGAGGGTVVGAFLLLGVLIGGGGVAVGLAAGSAIASALPGLYAAVTGAFGLDLMSQYFINYLPVEVRATDLVGIGATALAITLAASVYPAVRAARLLPGRVLAYE
jgi:lipoprotein-releasing system permease protein